MATSFVQGTFNGSSAQINITYGYLDKTHVLVYLNGVLKTVGVDYVWNSPAQIEILGGNPAAGTSYLAQRDTPNELLAEFQPGNLDTTDLNMSFLQAIYIAEEASDAVTQKITSLEGETGHTIQTVGTATGQFAVYDAFGNLVASEHTDAEFTSLDAAVSAAQGYRDSAGTYAGASQGYSINSAASALATHLSELAAAASASAAATSASNAAAAVGPAIVGAASKSPMVDADALGIIDSAASNALKKLTLANLVSSIFNGTRKITNGWFSDSFRIWDATDLTKGFGVSVAAVASGVSRFLIMPNRDVDLTYMHNRKYIGTWTVSGAASDLTNFITSKTNRVILEITSSTPQTNGQEQLQVLTAGGVVSSGYQSSVLGSSTGGVGTASLTAAFVLRHAAATTLHLGTIELHRAAPGSDTWLLRGELESSGAVMQDPRGWVVPGAPITGLRFGSVGGSVSVVGAIQVYVEEYQA